MPEYIQRMVKDSRSDRQLRNARMPLNVVESTSPLPKQLFLDADTPPHLIPFPARTLVLNLCPPHGHALPPPPPPTLSAAAAGGGGSATGARHRNLLSQPKWRRLR